MSSAVFAHEVTSAGASKAKSGPSALRVNKPDDTYEREADRVADEVSHGGRVASWSLSALSPNGVQRQPDPQPGQQTPEILTTGDIIPKVAQAIMATKAGKDALQAIKGDPVVKGATEFATTPAGIVIAGSAAVGVVSGLAAAHKPLPLQIPKLPLDVLYPGLGVKITYEGPVNRPTAASITLSFEPKSPTTKPKQTEGEKYRAETAQIAADQEKFRAGMHQDSSGGSDPDAVREQRAIEKWTLDRAGAIGKVPPITQWGAGYGAGQVSPTPITGAPDTGLKLPTFESPFKAKAHTLLDKKLELKPMAPLTPEPDAKKKEEIPVQRKAVALADIFADSAEVEAVTHSAGRPLDPGTRRYMESRIGFDFSKVRVHTDTRAAASARSLGAHAYTVGSSVVFGAGRYAPESTAGRKLLAHELTHVVQQSPTIARKPAGISPAPRHVQRKWSAGDFPGATWLIEKLKGFKGYPLFCTVIGQDLFTGEQVERNATTLTQGVLGLFDGGPTLFEKLKKAGDALETAYKWLLGELTKRKLTEEGFNEILDKAKAAVDKWHPFDSADRVLDILREPLNNLKDLASVVASKVLDFIFEAGMAAFGETGRKVYAFFKKVGNVISRIAADPLRFAANLFKAVQEGFKNFGLNILKHLGEGVKTWIFDELAIKGVTIPTEFSFASILKLILQVLGLTYEQRRPQLVEKLGESAVYFFETSAKVLTRIQKEGFSAIAEMIKEEATSIFESMIGSIKSWIIKEIVERGLLIVAKLANPAGEILAALESIYETVEFIIEKASKLIDLIDTVVNALTDIVEGNTGPAALKVEESLARTIPLLLRFIAGLLHLTGIGKSIREIIDKIRKPIDEVIGKVLDVIVKNASKLWEAGKADFTAKLENIKEWWNKPAKFNYGDEDHQLTVEGDGDKPEVFVHSGEKSPLKAFLKEHKATPKQTDAALKLAKGLSWKDGKLESLQKKEAGYNNFIALRDLMDKLKSKFPPPSEIHDEKGAGKENPNFGGGTMAYAFLSPDHPEGSDPTHNADPDVWKDLGYLRDQKVKYYLRGHLISNKLGGSGKTWTNLTPLTNGANQRMEADVESVLKQATDRGVKGKGTNYYHYEVNVSYGNPRVPSEKNVHTDAERDARSDVAEKRLKQVSWTVKDAEYDWEAKKWNKTNKVPTDENGTALPAKVRSGSFDPKVVRP